MISSLGDAPFLFTAAVLPVVLGAIALRIMRGGRTGTSTNGILKLLAGNAVVLAFLLSLLLLGAECYLRVVYDTTDNLNKTRVSRRWFDRYWVKNNINVLDNIDYEVIREPGRRRLTILGDSFTAAQGVKDVEDRFANIIRRERPDWEVHAIAQLGIDTPKQISAVRELSQLGYDFDVVVLAYCWNDILPVIGELVPFYVEMNSPQDIWKSYWIEHSLALELLNHRYRLYRETRAIGADFEGIFERAYAGERWDTHARLLTLLNNEVEQAGGRFAVVTFPRFLPLAHGGTRLEVMHERLGALWAELGIPHLDLLPVIEPHSGAHLVVNTRDQHPSEAAQRIVAEAMLPFSTDS